MRDLSDRIIAHYERHAIDWAADRAALPWIEKPWHERFVRALPARAAVLDLGCGSGTPVATYLAEQVCKVTGVDSSPTLISLCRKILPAHEWNVADMRSLALGKKFDGILAWDSFFHLGHGDQRRMFDVFAAHAASAAVLMFNSGPRHGEAIGEYRGNPLYHASLDAAEYERLLVRCGFAVLAHAVEDRAAGGRTIWLVQSQRQGSAGGMYAPDSNCNRSSAR
jgi:SAM-dependent methyltransferase